MKKLVKSFALATGVMLSVSPLSSFADSVTSLSSESATVSQWEQKDGKWFYNKNGTYSTGWELINSKWYYFNGKGEMQTGWILDNQKWYYLNANGDMKTGWLLDNKEWYFLNKTTGAMTTGWLNDGGKWYHFSEQGDMQTGWIMALSDGYWYYLHPNGIMAANTTINGYVLSPSGAWKESEYNIQKLNKTFELHKVKGVPANITDIHVYKGKVAVADITRFMARGDKEYRNLLVDSTLVLFPKLTTKAELNAAIDLALSSDVSVYVGSHGLVWFDKAENKLKIVYSGFDK